MKKYVLGLAAIGLIVAGSVFYACNKDGAFDTTQTQVVKPVGDIPGYADEIITYHQVSMYNCYRITTYVQRSFDPPHNIQKIYGSIYEKIDCGDMRLQAPIMKLDMKMTDVAEVKIAGLIDDSSTGGNNGEEIKKIVCSFDSYIITIDGELLTPAFFKTIEWEDEDENLFTISIDYDYIQTVYWQYLIEAIESID